MSKADQYRELLKKLFPKGKLWEFVEGTDSYKLLDAVKEELVRVDGRATQLLKEQDPRYALETLPDWEKEYGLPDECSVLGGTLSQRRTNLLAKIRSTGGQSAQYFIDLFADEGVAITITVEEPSYIPGEIGMEVTGDAPRYIWYVDIPDFQIDWFEAEDFAEDYTGRFLSSNNVACIIEKNKPAQTRAFYTYGT